MLLDSYRERVRELEGRLTRLGDVLARLGSQAPEGIHILDVSSRLEGCRKALTEKREVVIGVVGQIKAGKSTLLNAVLFDGECILPVAASPETARLTEIRHGESRRAVVEFYSEDEWGQMETRARRMESAASPGIRFEPIRRIIRETQDRVSQEELRACLREGTREIGFNDLADYVATAGRYSWLVKSIRLQIPRPELEDVVVVDTPGTNDPIEAREGATLQFLRDADAVLYCVNPGRFLDRTDLDLILTRLRAPLEAGSLLVAATRVDELSGEQRQEWQTMREGAAGRVLRCLGNALGEQDVTPLANGISAAFAPDAVLEVSALAYEISAWRAGRTNPTPQRQRDLLYHEGEIRARHDLARDPNVWRRESGCDRLRDAVEQRILARKGRILLGTLDQRIRQVAEDVIEDVDGQRKRIAGAIEELRLGLDDYRERLEEERALYDRLRGAKTGLEADVEGALTGAERDFHSLLGQVNLRPPKAEVGLFGQTSVAQVQDDLEGQVYRMVDDTLIKNLLDLFSCLAGDLKTRLSARIQPRTNMSERQREQAELDLLREVRSARRETEVVLDDLPSVARVAVRDLPRLGWRKRLFNRGLGQKGLQAAINKATAEAAHVVNNRLRETLRERGFQRFVAIVGKFLSAFETRADEATNAIRQIEAGLLDKQNLLRKFRAQMQVAEAFCVQAVQELRHVVSV